MSVGARGRAVFPAAGAGCNGACLVRLRKAISSMTESTEAAAKKLEIKKYGNRRYYDATHSRHLTLEEIRSFILQGYDIRVIDAKTSADLTAQLLTQIILEFDTPKLDSLPVPLLVRLIRMNDSMVKDFIEKYFNQALKSFFDYQQTLEAQIRQMHELRPAFPSVSEWTKAMLQPFAAVAGGAPPGPRSESKPPAATPSDLQPLQDMIRELQRQVAELKARPSAGGPRSRKTRRRSRAK
jgi:polyhydroxyalkanoate synthesis repressor PhaR